MNSARTHLTVDTDTAINTDTDDEIADISFRPFETGEREPGPTPKSFHDVGTNDRLERPGLRVRYVPERGPGGNGTAYNKLDWMVLDRDAIAGRQLLCRTTQSGARLICYALNQAIPR
jgi:hypothetical protein